VTTDFTGGSDSDNEANAVAIQRNGKIVAAGFARNSDAVRSDFALARYNSNGTLDTSFGRRGKVTTRFGGGRYSLNEAYSVAIQTNGKIVAAGQSNASGGGDFALARYNGNGSLDTSFGKRGKVLTDFGGALGGLGDEAYAVAIQGNGRIVAAGSANPTGDRAYFALARYLG
jgi:uncharacterized delta-60 repeat protein